MAPLDGSILSVALPRIGQDLGLSFESTLWVQASYLLTMAVLLVPLGRLADHRGRLNFYLAGIALFTLGSIGAALAVDGKGIILARVVQGSGGALLSSTSAALVTAVFPTNERGRAMGINTMAVYAGLSIGPPLGGFLVDTLGWHWIFLMNIPIGMVVLLWGRRLRKTLQEASGRRRLDLAGSALWGFAMIALLLPLTLHARWGLMSPISLGFFSASVGFFVFFLLRQRSSSDPLIDVGLLRHNPQFAFGNLAALLNYMALHAVALLTSVWLQLIQGLSATAAGWLMLGQPVIQSILSPIAGRLSDSVGSRPLTTAGMLLTALGMSMLAWFGKGAGLGVIVAALMVVGTGMASFSAPNGSSVLGSVGRDQVGLASSFLGTMRVTGMALSVAILGGLAGGRLGEGGWTALLKDGSGGAGAAAFVWGYRAAMTTGAGFALLGAVACLAKRRGAVTSTDN